MRNNVPDPPDIQNAMRYGYPDGPRPDPRWPKCPICGQECETVYLDRDAEIIGCDMCVEIADASIIFELNGEEDENHGGDDRVDDIFD